LIYAMIRDKEAFSELATLTLDALHDTRPKGVSAASEKEAQDAQPAEEAAPDELQEATEPKDNEIYPTVNTEEDTEEKNGKEKEKEMESPEKEKKPRSIAHLAIPGFVPAEEWLLSWRNQLPINTIVRLLTAVVPQIPALVCGSSGDETTILQYLKETTLVGLLPVPHPILIRRYQNNAATNMWFTTFMWGVIYLRNHAPPIFYGTQVRLFLIKMLDE